MDVSRSSTQIRRRSRSGFSAAADMPHATSEQRDRDEGGYRDLAGARDGFARARVVSVA